jgi:uncharacterized DUF497 family protein
MRFQWDDDKDRRNLEKHGLRFSEAALIFEGPVLTRIDSRVDYGEERCISIGAIRSLVVVVVVHTSRDDHIRLISARLANRRERDRYHEHLGQAPR